MRGPEEGDRLVCPLCPLLVEVSLEDPDASLSDMLNHIHGRHGYAHATYQVKLVDRTGREVE